jgi:hypothetical protein
MQLPRLMEATRTSPNVKCLAVVQRAIWCLSLLTFRGSSILAERTGGSFCLRLKLFTTTQVGIYVPPLAPNLSHGNFNLC